MSYTTPDMVVSPKSRITPPLEVLYDGGEEGQGDGFSIAKLKWDNQDAVAIRWNGSTDSQIASIAGTPQSRGLPTWFILPDILGVEAEKIAKELNSKKSEQK